MTRIFDIEIKTRSILNEFIEGKKNIKIDQLTSCYNELENLLLEILKANILQEVNLYANENNLDFQIRTNESFAYDGIPFKVVANEDPRKNGFLVIKTKNEIDSTSKSYVKELKSKITSLGKYNSVGLTLHIILKDLSDDLMQVSKETLESGYRFIKEFIKTSILKSRNQAIDELYSYLRSLFPEKVASQIYLFAVSKKKGIYLIDPLQYQRIEQITSKRKIITDTSPLNLISDLSTRILNEKDLAVRETVPNDITVQIKQSKTEFDAHNIVEGIGKAEWAIYQIDNLIIQPLVIEKPIWIEAAYPPDLRVDYKVEDILRKEREKFTQIVKNNYSLSKIVNKKIQSIGITKEAMELWGAFWGNFVKAFVQ